MHFENHLGISEKRNPRLDLFCGWNVCTLVDNQQNFLPLTLASSSSVSAEETTLVNSLVHFNWCNFRFLSLLPMALLEITSIWWSTKETEETAEWQAIVAANLISAIFTSSDTLGLQLEEVLWAWRGWMCFRFFLICQVRRFQQDCHMSQLTKSIFSTIRNSFYPAKFAFSCFVVFSSASYSGFHFDLIFRGKLCLSCFPVNVKWIKESKTMLVRNGRDKSV